MTHEAYIRHIPGSRRAVVMIHGILGTPRHFDFLLPCISDEWSVYNVLLDGHGGTVEDFSHTSMEKWKSQVSALLDDVLACHDEVILVAHSMGTLFSIQEAIARPEKLRSLLLLQVPLRPWLKLRCACYSVLLPFGIVPRAAEAMCSDCSLTLTRKLWKYLGWVPRFLELFAECRRTRQLLGQLRVPCRVFQCRQDEMVSMRSCKDLEKYPHYRMTVLKDSGHFFYVQEDRRQIEAAFSTLIS